MVGDGGVMERGQRWRRPLGVSPWALGFSVAFIPEHGGSPPPGRMVLHRALAP